MADCKTSVGTWRTNPIILELAVVVVVVLVAVLVLVVVIVVMMMLGGEFDKQSGIIWRQ